VELISDQYHVSCRRWVGRGLMGTPFSCFGSPCQFREFAIQKDGELLALASEPVTGRKLFLNKTAALPWRQAVCKAPSNLRGTRLEWFPWGLLSAGSFRPPRRPTRSFLFPFGKAVVGYPEPQSVHENSNPRLFGDAHSAPSRMQLLPCVLPYRPCAGGIFAQTCALNRPLAIRQVDPKGRGRASVRVPR